MPASRRTFGLLAFALIVAVAARTVAIDRLPGINGDEAWYGVNVNELLAGGTPFRQTPSGNVVNPVHSFPLLLISAIAEPSFVLLRAPEVLWGVLTVLLAYPLLAAPLGRQTALVATLLLAVSPTAVGYARIGWDPSGTPLLSLLAIACALGNRPVLAGVSAAVAYVTHPTSIFFFPVVLGAWGPHAMRLYATVDAVRRRRLALAAAGGALLALPIGAAVVTTVARMGRLPSLEMVTERVTSAAAWFETGLAMVRLFSGTTATAYFAGPMPPFGQAVADALAGVVLLLSFVAIWWSRHRGGAGVPMLSGLVAGMVAFHVIAGPVALEPGLERYAVPLLVPISVVCAVGLSAMAPRVPAAPALATGVLASGFVSLLAGPYFYALAARGGDAHQTFRTGRVEPKAAAYDYVRAAAGSDRIVAVFAEDWWAYWPVRYLAFPDRDRIFVEMIGHTPPVYPPGVAPRPYPRPPDRVYAIVFHQSPAWHLAVEHGQVLFTAFDPIGRPILHVVALPPEGPIPFADVAPWDHESSARAAPPGR